MLARSKGNYEGAVKSDVGQTDTSITQDFDAWFQQEGAYGYLPNDHRHTFKLFGFYQVTDQFRVGANFFAQSGRPYGCMGYHPGDPSPGATPSAWYCLGADGQKVLTPRGSKGRTGWVTNTDLRLSYDLVREREGFGSVTAALDVFNVFNVFNERNVTRVVEQSETTNRVGRPIPVVGGSQLPVAAQRAPHVALRLLIGRTTGHGKGRPPGRPFLRLGRAGRRR